MKKLVTLAALAASFAVPATAATDPGGRPNAHACHGAATSTFATYGKINVQDLSVAPGDFNKGIEAACNAGASPALAIAIELQKAGVSGMEVAMLLKDGFGIVNPMEISGLLGQAGFPPMEIDAILRSWSFGASQAG